MDKMAEGGRNERASLGIFTKKHTKYGSTSQSSYTNETYIKHYVKPGETLQGIALKYGTTVSKQLNLVDLNKSCSILNVVFICRKVKF